MKEVCFLIFSSERQEPGASGKKEDRRVSEGARHFIYVRVARLFPSLPPARARRRWADAAKKTKAQQPLYTAPPPPGMKTHNEAEWKAWHYGVNAIQKEAFVQ